MADIKTKESVRNTVKTIDRAAVASERIRSAAVRTKDTAADAAEENTAPLRRSTAHSRSKIPCADVRQKPGISCKNADDAGFPTRSAMPVKHGTTFKNSRMRSKEPSRKKPRSKRLRKPERARSKRRSLPEKAP